MRYTPHTSADREQMLGAIGIDSIEALYQHVPATLRQRSKINLPEGVSEFAVRQRLAGLASHNAIPPDWSLFLGGGIYHHFIPSAVDAIISRAEFATSYTPYQPEVSQGTLQALFEYQTLICQLTGMEVSNAAVYDGASAAAEAVLMSRRIQSSTRRRVLISRALHPHYRTVVATYLRNLPHVELEEIPFAATGATDTEELARRIGNQAICVVLGYPNFFGVIEDLGPAKAVCSKTGAHLISVTTEPLSLAVLKAPGEFGVDIAVGEGQSLGVPMSLADRHLVFLPARRSSSAVCPDAWWVKRSIAKGAAASFSLSPRVSSIFAVKKRRRISVPAKPSVRSRQRCSCLCSGRAACEVWPKPMFCALMTLLRGCKSRRSWRRFLAGPFSMSSCCAPPM